MSSIELAVAPGNEGQARAWDGEEGEIWAGSAHFFQESTALHRRSLLEAAAIDPADRVLDIGCGTGRSTLDAAETATAGAAVGIDLSSAMIERARRAAIEHEVANATFIYGDAQVHPFPPASFDVVISCTGAMFFADQVAAFTNIARSLKTDGRLAIVSWQGPDRNEWLRTFAEALTLGRGMTPPPSDAPGPFSHADAARTEQILTTAGCADVALESLELPMRFGVSADEGYQVLSRLLGWMTAELSDDDRAEAFARLRTTLEEHETPDGVLYGSSAWLITARLAPR